MQVNVLFFAYCKDLVGRETETRTLTEGATVQDILATYAKENPQFDRVKKNLLVAVNQEYAPLNQALNEGDEVAIFPPVSGGSGVEVNCSTAYQINAPKAHYALVRDPIHVERLIRVLSIPEDGAIVTFDGVVRNNSRGKQTRYVEYYAYEPMALKKIEEIGQSLLSQWDVNRVGIVHRLGKLEIGETSVLIVVTSAHRRVAFEACEEAINTLKKTVPIWKKEFFEDGEVWIEGDSIAPTPT